MLADRFAVTSGAHALPGHACAPYTRLRQTSCNLSGNRVLVSGHASSLTAPARHCQAAVCIDTNVTSPRTSGVRRYPFSMSSPQKRRCTVVTLQDLEPQNAGEAADAAAQDVAAVQRAEVKHLAQKGLIQHQRKKSQRCVVFSFV